MLNAVFSVTHTKSSVGAKIIIPTCRVPKTVHTIEVGTVYSTYSLAMSLPASRVWAAVWADPCHE